MSAERGRMTLSLIVRDTGETKWTRSFDGDTGDIFAFCDELIEKSVASLRIQINAFDNDRIADLPTDQLSLSELRSRAAACFYKCTVESWTQARDLLDRAVSLNPEDPTALAMRALAHTFLAAAQFRSLAPGEIESLADDFDRAVELAPRSDFIFTSRSFFRSRICRDAVGALQDSERALALNASYHIAYDARAEAHMLAGRWDAAIADFEKAVSLAESDPLLPFRLFLLAVAYHLAGRHEDALETLDRALQLRSGQRRYLCLKAIICRESGRTQEADEAEKRAAQLPDTPSIVAPLPALPDRCAAFIAGLVPEGSTRDHGP
jgi:tetratricopeptide (TPR) repeat protein